MVKKIDTIKRLRVFGDFLMLGAFLMLLWLFLTAYLNNGFTTSVNINRYGEAHVEMILLVFFLLPLFILTAALSFLDWRQTWKTKSMVASSSIVLPDSPRRTLEAYEEIICPRCRAHFAVKVSPFGSFVTCPYCGLKGNVASEDHGDPGPRSKEGPQVRVIKDIRR